MKSCNKLSLGLRKIKRQPPCFGHACDQKQNEAEKLRKHEPPIPLRFHDCRQAEGASKQHNSHQGNAHENFVADHLRAAAQMISYEVFMGISLMGVVLLAGSFSLTTIVEAQRNRWFVLPQFLGFVLFLIAGMAEARRLPFDLPEAEAELVAGFHSEYSGMKFGMFFVGEYLGITLISGIIATLFFGGWLGPSFLPPVFWFLFKTFFFICVFILLRASLPRPRYDQLMELGWKVLLPLSLLNLLITGAILIFLK